MGLSLLIRDCVAQLFIKGGNSPLGSIFRHTDRGRMYENEDYLRNRIHEIITEVGAIHLEEVEDRGVCGLASVIFVIVAALFAGLWYGGTIVFLGVFAPNTQFEAHTLWLVAASVYATAAAAVSMSMSVSGTTPNAKMGTWGWCVIVTYLILPLAGSVVLWAEHPRITAILPIIIWAGLFAVWFSFAILREMDAILSGYARKQWYARRILAKEELLASVRADLDRWLRVEAAHRDTRRIDQGREEPRLLN